MKGKYQLPSYTTAAEIVTAAMVISLGYTYAKTNIELIMLTSEAHTVDEIVRQVLVWCSMSLLSLFS